MHSIIDEITEVEAQAATIRQDAAASARETVAAAQAEALRQRDAQAEFARTKLREATQKAEAEGELLSAQILAQRAEETKNLCEIAEKKLPEAVKHLAGRIVS